MNFLKDNRQTIKFSFKQSLPVFAGYICLGSGFGILMQRANYSWLWCLVMAIAIYGGSMQYVAVDLLTGGATLIATAIMTVMINIRYMFYEITMLDKFKGLGLKKPYVIFALTDETYSLLVDPEFPEGVSRKKYYFFLSLFDQIYWISGCVLGNLIGNFIPFDTKGIDFSMTALFTVVFLEQWESNKDHIPAITGLCISVIMLILLGPDRFLIPAMVAITAALFIEKAYFEKSEAKNKDVEFDESAVSSND